MISTGILKKLAKTRSSDINDLAAVSKWRSYHLRFRPEPEMIDGLLMAFQKTQNTDARACSTFSLDDCLRQWPERQLHLRRRPRSVDELRFRAGAAPIGSQKGKKSGGANK
jgi:hypothetical protein